MWGERKVFTQISWDVVTSSLHCLFLCRLPPRSRHQYLATTVSNVFLPESFYFFEKKTSGIFFEAGPERSNQHFSQVSGRAGPPTNEVLKTPTGIFGEYHSVGTSSGYPGLKTVRGKGGCWGRYWKKSGEKTHGWCVSNPVNHIKIK